MRTVDTERERATEERENVRIELSGLRVRACVSEGVSVRTLLAENDTDDQSVDTEDTGHDDGNDVFHDRVRVHHTHRRDTHSRFGRAVRSAETCVVRSRPTERHTTKQH
jgi:hypothetical protein